MTCVRPIRLGRHYVDYVPCGRCIACRIQKTGEWQTRLLCEMEYYKESTFLTLTYDDAYLPADGCLDKPALQKFFKRLRHHVKDIKHFSVGEYGDETFRPHYHSLILGWYPDDCVNVSLSSKPKFVSRLVSKLWPFGFNLVGVVEQRSIDYVTGYIRKKLYGKKAKEVYDYRTPPFQLCSKNLGLRYAKEHRDEIIKNEGVVINGRNRGICRYFWNVLELGDRYGYEFVEGQGHYGFHKVVYEKSISHDMAAEREKVQEVEAQVKNLSDCYLVDDRHQRENNLLAKENLFKRGNL